MGTTRSSCETLSRRFTRPVALPRHVTDADLLTAPADEASEAPSTEPWTLPLARCPFALIDCEMTGTDPATDALLEVAVTRVLDGAVTHRFASLVRATAACHPAAHALHGIDPADIAAAPTFAELAPSVVALLDGAVPVMHGCDLDVAFLDRALADAGTTHRVGPCLDTVRLARRAVHARRYGLASVCAALGLAPVRWHRAGEDVAALTALFARLCAALAPVSARDLWQVRAADGPVRVRDTIAAVLAAHVGSRDALRLVVRTPGHAERELTVRVLWFRPPHVGLASVGAQRAPPILRADRVLRVAS